MMNTLEMVAKEISEEELYMLINEYVQGVGNAFPAKTFTVDGQKLFDGWYLKAEKIIFKSGSELWFSQKAQQNRNSFFIVAKEIVCEDNNSPGKISWQRNDLGEQPPKSGQAASGIHGSSDGSAGGKGSDGEQGGIGYDGKDAPNITLFVLKSTNSGPMIDFQGLVGGKGGKGQKGGDGGNGAKGKPASQSTFTCRRGAGDGGRGGDGGNGGNGGKGGDGGNGGIITMVTLSENIPSIEQKFRSIISGGEGGEGGEGGDSGNRGMGGPGGQEAQPLCQGNGSSGSDGNIGNGGQKGTPGNRGVDGEVFVGQLSQAEFDQYIWGNVSTFR